MSWVSNLVLLLVLILMFVFRLTLLPFGVDLVLQFAASGRYAVAFAAHGIERLSHCRDQWQRTGLF